MVLSVTQRGSPSSSCLWHHYPVIRSPVPGFRALHSTLLLEYITTLPCLQGRLEGLCSVEVTKEWWAETPAWELTLPLIPWMDSPRFPLHDYSCCRVHCVQWTEPAVLGAPLVLTVDTGEVEKYKVSFDWIKEQVWCQSNCQVAQQQSRVLLNMCRLSWLLLYHSNGSYVRPGSLTQEEGTDPSASWVTAYRLHS